jgi:hypothetical protein
MGLELAPRAEHDGGASGTADHASIKAAKPWRSTTAIPWRATGARRSNAWLRSAS